MAVFDLIAGRVLPGARWMEMLGFATIDETPTGYEQREGTSLLCRWRGGAENWLNRLVLHGRYRKWEPVFTDSGAQAHYEDARVFRVFPSEIDEREPGAYDSGILVAIWDTGGGGGQAPAARTTPR
jgi:hypothetical protein